MDSSRCWAVDEIVEWLVMRRAAVLAARWAVRIGNSLQNVGRARR